MSHLCTPAHVPACVGVCEPVMVAGVSQPDAAIRGLAPGQGEWRVGEALHAARHHHAPLTQGELGGGQGDGLETTGAHLVMANS